MRLLSKIYISPFAVLLITISFMFGLHQRIVFLYLIDLIHELFHVIMAFFLNVKLKRITFNLFGFSADLDNVEYQKFYKQILIFLSGPTSYFFILFCLKLLLSNNLISEYYYQVYCGYNLSLNLFNLLPLYPLDGGRTLDAIYRKFCPVKECFMYRKIWGIIGTILLIITLLIDGQYILTIFFLGIIVLGMRSIDKEYYNYLQNRLLSNVNYPSKISFNNNIYHFQKNIFLSESGLISEEEYLVKNIVIGRTKK